MEWFKELRTGQKVLFIINAVLAVASFALIFTGAGSVDFFIIGTAVASMNIFSILFARAGFKFGIAINTENAGDDAEPSELKYMSWYMNWVFFTLVAAACIICAFVF